MIYTLSSVLSITYLSQYLDTGGDYPQEGFAYFRFSIQIQHNKIAVNQESNNLLT